MNKAYALLDANNKAINFITWDGKTQFDHGQSEGNKLISLDGVESYGIGWTWNGLSFDEPAPPPPPVPAFITPRQCRLLLLQQGLLSQVEAMISQSTGDVRITWEYALEFRRDDPLLNQLALSLGLTQEQIDQFFILAKKL